VNLAGGTLALNGSTGSLMLNGSGAISNSTITPRAARNCFERRDAGRGNTEWRSAGRHGGTLNGVTLNCDVAVTNSALYVTNGLTLNGTLTLACPGYYAQLFFQGTQTLAGTGRWRAPLAVITDNIYAQGDGGSIRRR